MFNTEAHPLPIVGSAADAALRGAYVQFEKDSEIYSELHPEPTEPPPRGTSAGDETAAAAGGGCQGATGQWEGVGPGAGAQFQSPASGTCDDPCTSAREAAECKEGDGSGASGDAEAMRCLAAGVPGDSHTAQAGTPATPLNSLLHYMKRWSARRHAPDLYLSL